MRTLTKCQKKLLDIWFEENKEKLLDSREVLCFDVDECKLFSAELYRKLTEMNDTEILYQEINRYISDKGTALLYLNQRRKRGNEFCKMHL